MLNVILSTYKKNRLTIVRAYPWSFVIGRLVGGISSVIYPFLVYTYFFNGVVSDTFRHFTQTSDYITYVVSGVAVYILGVSTLMNVGRSFITEFREGTIEPILISPAPRLAYFIGCFLEQFIRSIMEFVIVLVVGAILGANLSKILSLSSLAAILLMSFSFFSMAILLASIMLHTRDTYLTQNTLFILLTVLTGVSYPIEYLPDFFQMIAKGIPMTYSVELFRVVVLRGDNLWDYSGVIAILLLLSAAYFLLGFIWYIRIEKKLIEQIFG